MSSVDHNWHQNTNASVSRDGDSSVARTDTYRVIDQRIILLLFLLLAFGRVIWELGEKPLWWDESLSLQRSEQPLGGLLLGTLPMIDGESQMITRDQHPFVYYLLLRQFIGILGISEFALRLLSAFAATLLVAALWALSRFFARVHLYGTSTPFWAGLLAAVSPFYLWYGQEARSYILWTLLATLSTYALLRWREQRLFANQTGQRSWALLYGLLGGLLLLTHYFSGLILVLHGVILGQTLWRRSRWATAVLGLTGLLALSAVGGLAAWWVLGQTGAGSNFERISLHILARDLLNAFSLGLSVNVSQVFALDILFGLLALLGTFVGLRSVHQRQVGWIMPVFVIAPVLALFVGNLVQPLYMNARHLAMVSGFYLVLVAAGLAAVTHRSRVAAVALGLVLMAGSVYSTVNYFTDVTFRKGPDLAELGADLRSRMHPGDLLLLDPPFAWRFLRYYLPVQDLEELPPSAGVSWRAVPLAGERFWRWPETFEALAQWRNDYRRIWLVTEGTHPFIDPEKQVETWLQANSMRIWEQTYFSPNAYLELDLFLTTSPTVESVPSAVEIRPDVVFGDSIALRGLEIEQPLFVGSMLPLTFYWEPLHSLDQRYKYVLSVEETLPDGSTRAYPLTEQEPYRGFLPTSWWRSGSLIREFSDVAVPDHPMAEASYRLLLFWYQAETLERLPVTEWGDGPVGPDEFTLTLPLLLSGAAE